MRAIIYGCGECLHRISGIDPPAQGTAGFKQFDPYSMLSRKVAAAMPARAAPHNDYFCHQEPICRQRKQRLTAPRPLKGFYQTWKGRSVPPGFDRDWI